MLLHPFLDEKTDVNSLSSTVNGKGDPDLLPGIRILLILNILYIFN